MSTVPDSATKGELFELLMRKIIARKSKELVGQISQLWLKLRAFLTSSTRHQETRGMHGRSAALRLRRD